MAMTLGLSPSEFWRMSPDEFGEWYNATRPRKQIGGLNESDLKALKEKMLSNEDYI